MTFVVGLLLVVAVSAQKPLLLGYFGSSSLDVLAHEAQASGFRDFHAGSYGVSPDDYDTITRSGGIYTPIFAPQTKYYPTRLLSANEVQICHTSCPKETESQATVAAVRAHPFAWGLEIGRRFRDSLRKLARTDRTRLSYQFDEIVPSASDPAKAHLVLPFLQGALQGAFEGRPELGDRPMQGAVHVAHPLAVTRLPLGEVERSFWKQLRITAKFLVFEQYPPFIGAPKAKAEADLEPLRNLRRGSSDMRALASRYVVGLTPGLRKGNFLGGRNFAGGQTAAQAHEWREAYMHACLDGGAVGVSVYNWVGPGNSEPANIQRVIHGISAVLHGGRVPGSPAPAGNKPRVSRR